MLEVQLPESLQRVDILPSFEPFLLEQAPAEQPECSITILLEQAEAPKPTAKLLSDVSAIWGEYFRFYEQDNTYLTSIAAANGRSAYVMHSARDFSHSSIFLVPGTAAAPNVLSRFMMVAFGQRCLLYQAVLIHASVISHKGRGYVFLGKSGTGKSTHSRLWLQHIADTALLNDDNPVIRLEANGAVYVYGTPWSGKTACYKNIRVPLQAFVRLQQAAQNQLQLKSGLKAFLCVLPSCTAIRWNKILFTRMTDTIEAVVQALTVATLHCMPNTGAVDACYQLVPDHK